MTQIASGKGAAWPGVALPVRVHDLLLGLAGRLDDDALADARELLASAEVDRSLDLVAGCLAAGPIAVSRAEHDELQELFLAAHADPAVVERLTIAEPDLVTRHRFATGSVAGVSPEDGVAEAANRVLDVLPDIRAVWAVWRLTPAGPATGPVPHRVVLVGVGQQGSAPATAYRVEHALRRAGITASVEVLRDGAEPTDYHRTAMRYANEVGAARTNVVAAPAGSEQAPRAERREPELTAPTLPSPPSITPPKISSAPDPEPTPWSTEEPKAEAKSAAAATDESLNDQELDLLRQLQEELARREQTDPAQPAAWQGDLGTSTPFDWSEANSSTMVNGIPLQPPDNR
ncbi:hypothetical protein [Actinokineospora spheciospongiae]|uniref:hypothetical protein n=1 Tax=Actinokineospora spheciospongiae TaxID=909613 RepID=UPI000D7124FF|nr:hypothetical protein [Actinokineospora spheciospongiae]PWW65962.1 hypothetical protein DFQ13_102723 [Actinokineospora spheciospongiae]